MNRDVAISVRGASKKYCRDLSRSMRYAISDALRDLLMRRRSDSALRPGEFWALRDVSFELLRGQALGVMGVNGAGKSTLLKMLIGGVRPTEGRIETLGRIGALSDVGLGFDPVLSGRENAYMSAAVFGIERERMHALFDEIVAFAELEEFIDAPVQIYSSGMRTRLGFSVATHLEPDILLVDEVLAVGDIAFQRKCLSRARRYLDAGGSLILVSHNAHQVQNLCDRCLVLDHGIVEFEGEAVEGVTRYLELSDAGSVIGDETGEISKTNYEENADPGGRADTDAKAQAGTVLAPSGTDAAAVEIAIADAVATAQTTTGPDDRRPADATGGEIDIEELGIEPLDPNGFRPTAPARAYIRYYARQSVEATWGICFLTRDLETTIACTGPLEPLTIPRGKGEVSCELPRLPFVVGKYAIRAALVDPATGLPFALRGFYDAPCYFEMTDDPGPQNNYRRIMNELIVLEDVSFLGPQSLECDQTASE